MSSSSSLSLRARVSSITAVASWPAFLSAPTCWLNSLRRALRRSAVVMASRRLASRERKSPSSAAGSAPRARSFSSNEFQVGTDKSEVEHRTTSLIDGVGRVADGDNSSGPSLT